MTCDVLVVGGGPAGLAAAYRAAQAGRRVVVIDDNPDAGGQIWRGGERDAPSREAQIWFARLRSVDIQLIAGARVFQGIGRRRLLAETSDGVRELVYEDLILATGARERFLPFPGWTLPNVMGAGGLQALAKNGLPVEGKKIVIAGSGPLLLAVAGYLRAHGADVLLIAEQAPLLRVARFGFGLVTHGGKMSQAFALRRELKDVRYLTDCWVVAAEGNDKLQRVTLKRERQRGKGSAKRWTEHCDYLACGFHLVPNLELAELFGCTIAAGAIRVDEFQQTSVPRVYAAGEATGIGGLELSLVEGEIAGLTAAGKREDARRLFAERAKQGRFANLLNRTFALRHELKTLATPDTIVCRCEDVVFDRLGAHDSWRTAKLQTRCGMGPCQGRICGSAVEFLFDWKVESVRPPVLPVRVESLLTVGNTD
jgi:NADPH-dependent 2,4-dienoyl-CoA reductase/sulfur reductase-like enzyme